MPGVDRTRGDQPVVVGNRREHFVLGDAIAFQLLGIDHDLQHFFAIAGKIGAQNTRNGLDVVTQSARQPVQRAFRYRAGKRDRDDRKQAGVELLHNGRIGLIGQTRACLVHQRANVFQRLLFVEIDIEFQNQNGCALIGARGDVFQPFDRAQIGFQRFDQKPLAIFRADTRIGHGHRQNGNGYIRIGFFRNADEGDQAGDDHHHDQRDDQPGVADGPFDDARHQAAPPLSGTASTCSPSLTNSWPTVITVTLSGRPVIHMPSGPSDTIVTGMK